jgi:photosystem II stability/assembly factor-like uncharacterized protein
MAPVLALFIPALIPALLPAFPALASTPASAFDAEDLVRRHVEALGGEAKIAALTSLRISGKLTVGTGDGAIDLGFSQTYKRPGMVRLEATLQGLAAVFAFDQEAAWQIQPFQGRKDPERLSADEAKEYEQLAELEGPLAGAKKKGFSVEYLGTEDVDGTPAHQLKVTRKHGDVQLVFLDPDHYLIIRIESRTAIRGAEKIQVADFGNYEQVQGVWIPFSIESGPKGAPRDQRRSVEKAEAGFAVEDAFFKFPVKGAPAAAPGAATVTVLPGSSNPPPAAANQAVKLDAGSIGGLGARNIGSATMSGRIAAIAARNEGGKTTVFVGAASGGVWRSDDGGTTMKPVFDKNPVQSIGAIAIDPSRPKTVWVGTGESWTRNSASIGDGIYRSNDNGETWTHLGLAGSERIVKIVVHPKNGEVVFACVPGRLWSDSTERGVYKTSDGGKTWTRILSGPNASTGCSGLTMDPTNPEVLMAGLWDFRRKGWTFRSGGEGPEASSGSGLFRTADGGKTWSELSSRSAPGLPETPWGRVEVVFAPSNASVVYAFIEGKDSSLFASADGGKTWQVRDKSKSMVWRPFYFARLVVDPKNPERLFKPNLELIVSEDGGKSFAVTAQHGHGDWHDLWIDPDNPKHVIGGDDGGLWISYDGGNRWWKGENLPVSQFYHVAIDDKDPYLVYGGLQDNNSFVVESEYPGGIGNERWDNVYFGDGFWTMVDPTDPDAVYAEFQGGYIGRVDRKTRALRDIQPKAGLHEKLRFNWNTPIHTSPTARNTLYIGSQFLFRSRDRGDSWERISPDLTTNDPQKQKQEESGGITIDNSSAEMHTTIFSISESPKDGKLIWVGTDDGNVQLTQDGGKSWTNVVKNVPELPPLSWVSTVEASRFDANVAYATFDRHTFGDFAPYVYRTGDRGKTWTRIAGPEQGLRGYAHVIKEDVVSPTILFVGTEFGLWITTDGGKSWAEFKGGNFPSVAVRDLALQPRTGDLVLATHGRGIWIIDDLAPLRALAGVLDKDVAFLPGRNVQQRMPGVGGYWAQGDSKFSGENPLQGAVITYYQRTRHLFGPLKLEVVGPDGKVVDTIGAGKRRGINRVAWPMRIAPPRVPRAAQVAFNASQGPRVVPGTYKVRLTSAKEVLESKLVIELDRRAPYKPADKKQQFDASMKVHALFSRMSATVDRIEAARTVAAADAEKAGDAELKTKLGAFSEELDKLKKLIVATKEGGAITGEERLREHADILYGALQTWEGRPTRYQVERIDVLGKELAEVEKNLEALFQKDAKALEPELKKRELAPIPTEAPKTEHGELAPRSSDLRRAAAFFGGAPFVSESFAEPERR